MRARRARFYQGAEAVRTISQAGLYPANVRLLDANEALNNGFVRRAPERQRSQLRPCPARATPGAGATFHFTVPEAGLRAA